MNRLAAARSARERGLAAVPAAVVGLAVFAEGCETRRFIMAFIGQFAGEKSLVTGLPLF